jgi:trimethylguanosine synthase
LTFSADASSDGPKKYPLSAIEAIPGDELFELTAAITPNIAYFLPRNVDVKEVSQLAKILPKPASDGQGGVQRHREWVELEEEWVGDKLKAVTAYYGGLVAE